MLNIEKLGVVQYTAELYGAAKVKFGSLPTFTLFNFVADLYIFCSENKIKYDHLSEQKNTRKTKSDKLELINFPYTTKLYKIQE